MEQRAQQKKTLIQGLTAMFPSVRSFVEFEQDDREISGKAIPYIFQAAYDAGLIQNASREAFIEWLPTIWSGDCTPAPEGVTFGEVLDELTGSNSVNMLLEQVNKIAERFHLPTIQAPMVTRLKQDFHLNTPRKRGLIRLLAFRCGEKYPELGWQYERLRQLPRTTAPNIALARETEGVVLEVAVQGRRTLLPPEAIDWLKHELAACIHDLGLSEYLTRRQISRSSATSVLLRIPRKPGFETVGEPRLYTQAIRDSLALAHQMTLRWLLSAYSSVHNVLLIGIYAGPFREAQIDLHPLLDQHLSNAPTIVLTDFAYLCARVAQVKVGFEPFLSASNFWRVAYFWTYTYYDVIPTLLQEDFLPATDAAYVQFQREVFFPETRPALCFKALIKMHQFPDSTLLLTEIAKVLMARRMWHEADAILAQVFLLTPDHVVARIMRMLIYINIALEQPDRMLFDQASERAIAEGLFITDLYPQEEEAWCELGLVYYARALVYLVWLRCDAPDQTQGLTQQDVAQALTEAERYFRHAMTVSPTGNDNRALFWLLYARGLAAALQKDGDLFSARQRPQFIDAADCFRQVGLTFFRLLGWLPSPITKPEELPDDDARRILDALLALTTIYENSVLSQIYLPNIKYAFCCLLWDFAPRLTVGVCRQILCWLEECRDEAQRLIAKQLGVYAVTSTFVSYQTHAFIACVTDALNLVTSSLSTLEWEQDDEALLDTATCAAISSVKLMFLHLDRPHETGAIVRKTSL